MDGVISMGWSNFNDKHRRDRRKNSRGLKNSDFTDKKHHSSKTIMADKKVFMEPGSLIEDEVITEETGENDVSTVARCRGKHSRYSKNDTSEAVRRVKAQREASKLSTGCLFLSAR
jgi:hypothetical protein